jgi:hypothetical protein
MVENMWGSLVWLPTARHLPIRQADMFILESHRGRGRGLSKQPMRVVMSHPELQSLRRWHLVTRDTHGLYRQFGFSELKNSSRHMEIHASKCTSVISPIRWSTISSARYGTFRAISSSAGDLLIYSWFTFWNAAAASSLWSPTITRMGTLDEVLCPDELLALAPASAFSRSIC